jgi:hypothetical protein
VRLEADGTVDATFPAQQLPVREMAFLSDGRMLVGSSPDVTDDAGIGVRWSIERLFATPQPVTATPDAGAEADATIDAGPTSESDAAAPADAGAGKRASSSTTEQLPTSESEQQEPGRGGSSAEPSPAPSSKMTQEPTIGCTISLGNSGSREVPFLALILAVALLARRRAS